MTGGFSAILCRQPFNIADNFSPHDTYHLSPVQIVNTYNSGARRKIIVGAIVTTEALKDPKIAKWLASTLRKNATREVDKKELAGLLADLDAKTQSAGAGEA